MYKKIGSILNYLVAFGLLAFGIMYLTKSSFMSYHSEAVSVEWVGIEHNFQFLILALMKTIGGGFIVSAIVIAFLQIKFISDKLSWIALLILIVGIIIYGASIYAQILIRMNTPGNPPTAISILGFVTLIVAYIFNRISIREK